MDTVFPEAALITLFKMAFLIGIVTPQRLEFCASTATTLLLLVMIFQQASEAVFEGSS